LSLRTKVSNFLDTRGKTNNKTTNNIKHISRRPLSIAKTIKEYTQPAKKKFGDFEHGNDMKHYKTNIKKLNK